MRSDDILDQARSIELKRRGRPTYKTLSILGYLYYLKNDFSSASNYLQQACDEYERQDSDPPIRPEENPYLWLAQVEYFQGLRDQRASTLRMAVNAHRRAMPDYTFEGWWREGKKIVLANSIESRKLDVAELCLAASRTPGQAAPDKSYLETFAKLYRYKGWKGDNSEDWRTIISGANWSAAIKNPFRSFGATGQGLESALTDMRASVSEPVVFVLHLAHPRVEYTDGGKSSFVVGAKKQGL